MLPANLQVHWSCFQSLAPKFSKKKDMLKVSVTDKAFTELVDGSPGWNAGNIHLIFLLHCSQKRIRTGRHSATVRWSHSDGPSQHSAPFAALGRAVTAQRSARLRLGGPSQRSAPFGCVLAGRHSATLRSNADFAGSKATIFFIAIPTVYCRVTGKEMEEFAVLFFKSFREVNNMK
jgi:hypothetical protein